MQLEEKERIEIDFWRNSESESPEADSVENVLNKASEARAFLESIRGFTGHFQASRSILELGAGQCWASCIVKRLYPSATVIGTDISEAAVASAHKWERIFGVRLDGTRACRSYATPFETASFDLVFACAAAHHFVRHRRTFAELARILKPGGVALYLREPGCRRYIHGLAHRRVNRKRPEVPEDVLIYRDLERLAREAGLQAETIFDPTPTSRGPVETVYYMVLQRMPLLQHLLPCSFSMLIRKPSAELSPTGRENAPVPC